MDGGRDPEFLYTLLVAASGNRDNELTHAAAASYLKTRPDLLTDRNLKLLPRITKKTSDPGFAVLRNHAVHADQVLGKGYSAEIVKTIIFDELVLPVIRIGGEKIDYGMIQFYKGELAKNVDWDQLKAQLDLKYPEYSRELLLSSKLTYLDWSENWPLLNNTIADSLAVNKNAISSGQLKTLANKFFLVVDDIKILQETLAWAKLNLMNLEDKDDKLNFMVTYAQLLDKAGQKNEAIKQLRTTVQLSEGKVQYYIDMLGEMEKRNKIK